MIYYSMITKEQIDSVQIGTVLRETYDTRHGVALPNARWHERPVVEIFARGVDIYGKAYVCGYCQFGPTSRISFSLKEGENRAEILSYSRTDDYLAKIVEIS